MNQEPIERIAVKTPESFVDASGKPYYGTFLSPFPNLNLLDFKPKKPLRRIFNKFRLTQWQATEVKTKNGIFLMAIYRFGLLNIHLVMFYDKDSNHFRVWNHTALFLNKSVPAKSLFNGSKAEYRSKKHYSEIINRYEEGFASVFGRTENKKSGLIEYDFRLKQRSKPSIVSIPIKEKYPLYTEKDLFDFEGSIKIDGVEMIDGSTFAIIDDHRGYYPRHSGYDWVTCFGEKTFDSKLMPFGLNLTEFRMNPDPKRFNENGYLDNTKFHFLPNVSFTKKAERITITDGSQVHLEFTTLSTHKISLNLLLFKIDYQLHIGLLNGTVHSADHQQIVFDNDLALSEYRYTII
ncbi:MAG: DUF2804 family protein [Bacilli bacterium]|nr:DUF2804 family protein [Bacilli bacterium]MBN2877708.1 DUF2804 family protein [Bacilli bacterium]